jgi:hypothetical protein
MQEIADIEDKPQVKSIFEDVQTEKEQKEKP